MIFTTLGQSSVPKLWSDHALRTKLDRGYWHVAEMFSIVVSMLTSGGGDAHRWEITAGTE